MSALGVHPPKGLGVRLSATSSHGLPCCGVALQSVTRSTRKANPLRAYSVK